MSVYGDNPRYIIGAIRQTELAAKYYPDWRVRIYTDNRSHFEDIDADIRDCYSSTGAGMFWRFRPMFESDDNITMVRDADGRITVREAMAVNEWLESGKKFHTFRDHIAHYEFPIIGCAFAFRGAFPISAKYKMEIYEGHKFYYLLDQEFLRDVIWPLVADDTMVHEMHSGWFKETRAQMKNRYAFCGNGWDEFDMPLYPPNMEELQTFNTAALPPNAKFDEGKMQ